ncbi:T9SS type A sorting domain-containing protein [Soonwooa sp.]|uniref:T9SS type A sorting domain-containing protein n=1 Tax=Soonwooa sp. TaxID=1938592 RepID=UPI00261A99DC|nr:T9SS type A sorting domain-containing protein [Soonwooa sp.]
MKKIYLLTLLILGILFNAQETSLSAKKLFQVNTYNGGQLFKTIFDNDGNHLSVGYANGPYTFLNENITSIGINDLYLAKTDRNSDEKIWLKTLNSGVGGKIQPYYISVDNNSNIYVAATFEGTIKINSNSYTSNELGKAIILKYDNNGKLLWGSKIDAIPTINIYNTKIVKDGNLLFYLKDQNLVTLNADSGDIINQKTFTYFSISAIQIKNSELFLACSANNNIQILGSNFNSNAGFILKTDLNLEPKSFIKFYGNSNQNARIFDILISDDNNLYIMSSLSSSGNLIAESSSGYIKTGLRNANQAGYTSNFWLSKFSLDFNNSEWMYGHLVNTSISSFSGPKLYQGNDNDIDIIFGQANLSGYFNSNIFYSFTGRGLLNVRKDGNLRQIINGIPFDNYNGNYNVDIKHDSENLYVSVPRFDFSNMDSFYSTDILKKGNQDTDLSLSKTYQPKTKFGYLRARELFKVDDNGDVFNSYVTKGKLFNFFGQENETTANNNIISRLSANGTLQWKIKAEGVIDNYTGYWIEGHRIDINNNKEVVSVFNCYHDDLSSCKLIDSQGNSEEFYSGAKISKFNDDGSFKWSKDLGFNVSWPGGPSVKDLSTYYDNAGNVIVVGKSRATNLYYNDEQFKITGNSFFILKLDSNGNKMLFKSFPYNASSELFTRFDQQNNIYMFLNIENQTSDMHFDSVTIPQNGQSPNKFVMLKMNPQGNVLLGKNYLSNDANNVEYISTFAKFDGKDFVLYGHTSNGMNLQHETFANPYPNTYSFSTSLISKISVIGDIIWSYPFYSSSNSNAPITSTQNYNSNNIDFDEDKNIYVTDIWRGSMNYRNTEIAATSDLKTKLFKLDADANLKYYKAIDNSESNPYISVYGKDKIAVASNSSKNFLLDKALNDLGGSNSYILFLEKEELATQNISQNIFNIYPNPTSDVININSKEKIKTIEIYDATGKIMISTINSNNQVDVRKLINGIYYIRISTDNNNFTSKFIKK